MRLDARCQGFVGARGGVLEQALVLVDALHQRLAGLADGAGQLLELDVDALGQDLGGPVERALQALGGGSPDRK